MFESSKGFERSAGGRKQSLGHRRDGESLHSFGGSGAGAGALACFAPLPFGAMVLTKIEAFLRGKALSRRIGQISASPSPATNNTKAAERAHF